MLAEAKAAKLVLLKVMVGGEAAQAVVEKSPWESVESVKEYAAAMAVVEAADAAEAEAAKLVLAEAAEAKVVLLRSQLDIAMSSWKDAEAAVVEKEAAAAVAEAAAAAARALEAAMLSTSSDAEAAELWAARSESHMEMVEERSFSPESVVGGEAAQAVVEMSLWVSVESALQYAAAVAVAEAADAAEAEAVVERLELAAAELVADASASRRSKRQRPAPPSP